MDERGRRLRALLRAHPWFTSVLNGVAGLAFVVGCLLFYRDATYTAGVTSFLVGSVLMTTSVALDAYARYEPGR